MKRIKQIIDLFKGVIRMANLKKILKYIWAIYGAMIFTSIYFFTIVGIFVINDSFFKALWQGVMITMLLQVVLILK